MLLNNLDKEGWVGIVEGTFDVICQERGAIGLLPSSFLFVEICTDWGENLE
jgi:hypothetical protein